MTATPWLRLTPDQFHSTVMPLLSALWPRAFRSLTPEQAESWQEVCCDYPRGVVEHAIKSMHKTLTKYPTPAHLNDTLEAARATKSLAPAPGRFADPEANLLAWREHWDRIRAACEAAAQRAGMTLDDLIAEAREKCPDLTRGYALLTSWAKIPRQAAHDDRAALSTAYGYLKRLGIADPVPSPDQLRGIA